MKKSYYFIAIAILIIVFIAFITRQNYDIVQDTSTAQIIEANLSDYLNPIDGIKTLGLIESENEANIASEASTPISTIYVSIGQKVETGDLLISFEQESIDNQLSQASLAVQRAQTQLNAVVNGATEEDLAISQNNILASEISLANAEIQYSKLKQANEDAIEDAENAVIALYDDTYQTLLNSFTVLKQALITASDYQIAYFTCTTDQLCYTIESIKADAMYSAFGIQNAGKYNAQTIGSLESGIIDALARLDQENLDGQELKNILEETITSFRYTQETLEYIRNGLDTYLANGSTSTDETIVETEISTVNSTLTNLVNLQQSFDSIEGGIQGGNATNVETLKTTLYQEELLALSNIEAAKINLSTAKNNYTKLLNGATDEELNIAQIAVLEAQAAYDNLLDTKDNFNVTAPFPGTISFISAKSGELVGIGQPLIGIVNEDLLQVKTYLTSEQSKNISSHDTIVIDNQYTAIINAKSPSVDGNTGKVELILTVIETKTNLIIGDYIDVEIRDSLTHETYLIPSSAIIFENEKSYIISSDTDIHEFREVSILSTLGSSVEIQLENPPEKIILNPKSDA